MGVATASTSASLLIDQTVRGEPIHGLLRRATLLHPANANSGPLDGLHRARAHATHYDDLAVMKQAGEGSVIMPMGGPSLGMAMAGSRFDMIVVPGRVMGCLGILTNLSALHDAPLGFENQESPAATEVSRNGLSVHRWEGDLHRILFSALGARPSFACRLQFQSHRVLNNEHMSIIWQRKFQKKSDHPFVTEALLESHRTRLYAPQSSRR